MEKKVKQWKADRKDWVQTYGVMKNGELVFSESDSEPSERIDEALLKIKRKQLLSKSLLKKRSDKPK